MQKHRGFEKKIELVQAAGRGFGSGYALHPAEDLLNGTLGCDGAENNFVRIRDAKADDVAIFQGPAFDGLFVHIKTAPVASIFEVEAIAFGNNCGALARDTAVVQLEVVSGFAAAPDEEG